MNRLINELSSATEINNSNTIVINDNNGVLKKVPHYKLGHKIHCNFKYSAGIECFRITAPNDNGVLETTAFMIPGGSIKSATVDGPYEYTGSPIVPNITSVSVGDSILITDPDIISANFQIENLDNTNANTLASVKIVPKTSSSYTGSAIANFVITTPLPFEKSISDNYPVVLDAGNYKITAIGGGSETVSYENPSYGGISTWCGASGGYIEGNLNLTESKLLNIDVGYGYNTFHPGGSMPRSGSDTKITIDTDTIIAGSGKAIQEGMGSHSVGGTNSVNMSSFTIVSNLSGKNGQYNGSITSYGTAVAETSPANNSYKYGMAPGVLKNSSAEPFQNILSGSANGYIKIERIS